MRKNKKVILIISSILVAIILVVGTTFAFFMWNADKEALVNVTVSSGAGTCELIDDNELEIFPTYSKYHGRKIKLHAKQEVAEKAYITWEMVVKQINKLQDKTFMYELINNTTGESYGTGTFENITSEEGSNTITFKNDNEVLAYNKDYEFTLYLWIDGTNGINSIDMTNETIDFDMTCSMAGTNEGTISDQNVLMIVDEIPQQGSNFLNGNISRNQISSVTFLEDVEIPTNAIDVSKNNDSSVMMWYGPMDANNLYDVYITGKNGKVIIEDAKYLFARLPNVTEIDLSKTNTSFLTSMERTFLGCNKLLSLNLSNVDTSNVTSMYATFSTCISLTDLDLTNFNTSNVTDMSGMFASCVSLLELDLSNFDTSNVEKMSGMFANCGNLTNIDINNFDTSKVTEMLQMFQGCSSLTELNLTNFNTSNVETMYGMFYGCENLLSLDVSSFDTSKVTDMMQMFQYCKSLTNLDVSSFNTYEVEKMNSMFFGCENLINLDVKNFVTNNVTDMRNMFGECKKLTSLDLSNFNTSNVQDMQFMFYYCTSLTSLDITNFNTSNVINMSGMFQNVPITELILTNFNTSRVTDMSGMFYDCVNLETLDISSFDITNVSIYTSIFNNVPTDCNFIVKDVTQKNWITNLNNGFNNITVINNNS